MSLPQHSFNTHTLLARIVGALVRTAPVVALVTASALVLAGCDTREFTSPNDGAGAFDSSVDSTLSVDVTPDVVVTAILGEPLPGLSPDELARFEDGKEDFQEIETIEDGLGPVFNEAGCVTCHDNPIGGTNGRLETRFGKWENGQFDALARLGGSLIQDKAIGPIRSNGRWINFVPEVVPRRANVSVSRVTTPLFGLGLVDAIPDAALIALARSQARNTPSTAGRIHYVQEIRTGATRVGRFGWKSQVPTLFQFSGDAYLNEMGITNPEFPNENAPQGNADLLRFNPVPGLNDDGEGVDLFTDFMSFLGPPPRGRRTSDTDAGGQIFRNIGCANCHTPTHETGDSPVPALAHKVFQPYSDFLLHDMGRLGDGIEQGNARGREFRTAPLWGLRSRPTLLHDGRATTATGAILEHDGQGRAARERFTRLSFRERQQLAEFLKSL